MITTTVTQLAESIQVDIQAPPGTNKFLLLLSWLGWFAMIGAVAALVIIGGKFGYEKKQGTADSESGERVAKALIGCVLISVAGGLVGGLVG